MPWACAAAGNVFERSQAKNTRDEWETAGSTKKVLDLRRTNDTSAAGQPATPSSGFKSSGGPLADGVHATIGARQRNLCGMNTELLKGSVNGRPGEAGWGTRIRT